MTRNQIAALAYQMRLEQLYLKARTRWPGKDITPASGLPWNECFVDYEGIGLTLTYNIGNNTHMEVE